MKILRTYEDWWISRNVSKDLSILFFFYSKTDNLIKISIDPADWGDFLVNKETM